MKKRFTIKRKVLFFSIILYPVIFIIGSLTFVMSMQKNAHLNAGFELIRKLELERHMLETSVNSEIVIVLKMASSPLIQQYFLNPANAELEKIAHEEIASYRRAFAGNSVFWANDIDKIFWFDEKARSIIDPENPEEYWYNMTLYETEKYNFNINYNPEIFLTNLWINAPVFDLDRRPIGIVGTGVSLTSFVNSIYSSHSGKEEFYLFNALDEITGARDTSLVTNKITLDKALGETANEILARVKARGNTLETGEVEYFSQGKNVIVLGKVPALDWYITAIRPITLADALSGSITALFVIMMIVIAALFTVFYLFTTGMLRRATQTADRVFTSLEKNDLTVQIKDLSQDELGDLMKALGSFLDKLKSTFALFSQNASMVSGAVNDLSTSAKQITTTANEQSASVAEIVSTMEKNKNLSGQVAGRIHEVADLAEQTKSLSQRGADLHTANEDMMLDIRSKNSKIVDEIKNLRDVLSRIDESVQIIDTITDKTKLIAFNAALEASSSGEAGLRFAVVAGEIRRFADNVVDSALEIKDRIAELQSVSDMLVSEADIGSKAIDFGYNRMVEQKEVYKNIVNVSQNVAEHSRQISGLSRQQELAAEQIFITLKEISIGVTQFVTATASTAAITDKLNAMTIELRETLAKYRVTQGGIE